ncbi:MAG: hypothetical protein JNK60_09725 [Acidobacteria bacterium]|nr:hypothetical protein [Acidobacteriota bacterium]
MNVRHLLALAAAFGGFLAPFGRDQAPAGTGPALVAPLELAGWIRDRRPGLRVVDLRSTIEVRLPRGERFVPEERFAPQSTVVLVSEDGAGESQRIWARLRAQGVRDLRILERGAEGWIDDVLSPTTPSELSRYFGGVPRLLAPGETAPPRKVRAALVRGRGC